LPENILLLIKPEVGLGYQFCWNLALWQMDKQLMSSPLALNKARTSNKAALFART
jgi:hypothetical protein